MNGESEPHPIMICHLMARMMVAIGEDRGLPLVSLSRMRRIIIVGTGTEIRPRLA